MTTAKDIIPLLRKRHANAPGIERWVFFEELRLGTGIDNKHVLVKTEAEHGQRKVEWVPNRNNRAKGIDAWAMSVWAGDDYKSIGYEIKVSRGDWLRELANPDKRIAAMRRCNQFYFVAPDGIIKPHEVPIDSGLLVIVDGTVRKVKHSPTHAVAEPSWAFYASLCRRLCRDGGASLFDELIGVEDQEVTA